MVIIYKIIGYHKEKQVKETESKYYDMAVAVANMWSKYGVKVIVKNEFDIIVYSAWYIPERK